MKLDTDGSFIGNPGMAGCGGVIRDDRGCWIAGFSKRIGITNSLVAELWGLRDGFMLCCSLNISSLVVELDAKAIVHVLGNPSYVNNIVSPILDNCRLLVSRIQQILIKHCFRQVNRCADSLVRMSISQDFEFSSFDSLLVDIAIVFEDDLNEMYSIRICPEPIVAPLFVLLNCLLPKRKSYINISYNYI